jgi:hypothetical protein
VPELAALNTTWKAIASTAAVDARDNSDTRPSSVSGGSLGVRIFLLNDTLLTNNNDALWNTLQFAFHTLLNINENGDVVVGDQKPWTGTSTIGTENVLGNWNQTVPPGDPSADTDNDGFVGIADLNEVLGNWNAGTPPSDSAAVPEPGSLALLAGLGVSAASRRRSA